MTYMGKRLAVLFTVVCALTWGATAVKSAEVTVAFAGVITTVLDLADVIPDTIGPGDPVSGEYTFVSGEYTFDPDVPPGLMIPGVTFYQGAMLCSRFQADGLEFFGEPNDLPNFNTITYSDEIDANGGTEDRYGAQMNGAEPDFSTFNVNLATPGPSNAVVPADLVDLSTTPPDLNDFVERTFLMQTIAGGAIISGDLTQLALAAEPLACPEPGRAGVLAALAALIGLPRVSRSRNASQSAEALA
jgi:hypothetical protein